ncbi:MAG: hypothetical protein IJ011_04160, partial [Clostridia bacterium]|nr:hypothetical protein [Clostridia bacterium]
MNSELKEAALAVSKLVSKYGENEIVNNANRFYGVVCDTLTTDKYSAAKNLIKKGLDSGAYATVIKKKSDRFGEAKRASLNLVNSEFMAEAHAREILAILLVALDSSQKNVTAVENWVDELSAGTQSSFVTPPPSQSANNTTTLKTSSADAAPLLKRAFIFLEDKNWISASQYAEKVLDRDPECSKAYLAKLMAELKVPKMILLGESSTPQFTNKDNFKKACRFADAKELGELMEYEKHNVYSHGVQAMRASVSEDDFKNAAKWFALYPAYKDSEKLQKKCLEDAETARLETLYQRALSLPLDRQEKAFSAISGYKDADYQKKRAVEALKQKREYDRIQHEKEVERQRIENERYLERLKKQKSEKIRNNFIAVGIMLAGIGLDLLCTFSLKDGSGAFRWIWLPLLAVLFCGASTAGLCLMVNYNKAGAWTLIVHMIAGALWGLLRGVVVVIANFAAAQGFWAVVGA